MEREEQRKQLEAILACQGLCNCGRSVLPARDYACRLLARSEYKVLLEQIYRSLGGCGLICPANVGDWDIVTSTFLVEFDEAQHFNRYRRLTLDCTLYRELPLFPLDLYGNFCVKREPECRKRPRAESIGLARAPRFNLDHPIPEACLEREDPLDGNSELFMTY